MSAKRTITERLLPFLNPEGRSAEDVYENARKKPWYGHFSHAGPPGWAADAPVMMGGGKEAARESLLDLEKSLRSPRRNLITGRFERRYKEQIVTPSGHQIPRRNLETGRFESNVQYENSIIQKVGEEIKSFGPGKEGFWKWKGLNDTQRARIHEVNSAYYKGIREYGKELNYARNTGIGYLREYPDWKTFQTNIKEKPYGTLHEFTGGKYKSQGKVLGARIGGVMGALAIGAAVGLGQYAMNRQRQEEYVPTLVGGRQTGAPLNSDAGMVLTLHDNRRAY